MDNMLKAVKTERKLPTRQLQEVSPEVPRKSSSTIQSPQDVLRVLKEGPSIDEVRHILSVLSATHDGSFNIAAPGALAAQIIQVLVSQTIPNFWDQIKDDREYEQVKSQLLKCMKSVSGLGAIIARLKALTSASKNGTTPGQLTVSPEQIHILVVFLEELLQGSEYAATIWRRIKEKSENRTRRTVLWKDFVSLIATSRLISAVAEAEDVVQKSGKSLSGSWIAKGNDYTRWLARNIAHCAQSARSDPILTGDMTFAAADMCRKALVLGYTDCLVEELIIRLPITQLAEDKVLIKLVQQLHAHEQRSFLMSILRILTKIIDGYPSQAWDLSSLGKTPNHIASCAAFLRAVLSGIENSTVNVVELLTKPDISLLTGSGGLRRAVLVALSEDEDRMQIATEKLMEKFGDQMFVRHSPIIQQEAAAQLLLMACGYVHRKQPMFLFTIAKSSARMHGISNRLNSTSPRARWLGMVVSMTISKLTDKKGSQLSFTDDSMETPEAKWYRKLVEADDKIGSLDEFYKIIAPTSIAKAKPKTVSGSVAKRTAKPQAKPQKTPKKPAAPTGLRIVELGSDDEEEDELVPYAKPDSDPEDEDEDPTLVQRNKPKAPVYIRDLIIGLCDTENYDRHRLALTTAPNLIRRKANFGKEVSDHSEELASILMGMNDQFEMDDFHELRQEALIAVLVAQPTRIAPYLARSCFEGDYSLQQRTTMLTALGLGAREIAGYKDEDRLEAPSFPTKQLPEHLHKVYSETKGPSVAKVSSRLEASMVGPLALNAADQLSGPNALKVRTFSSRMSVEKARKKPIPNALAKIVAENFFFPLTGRWWSQMQAYGNKSVAFSSHLLPTYLRTLAILLNASGPSTLSLPQMTSELWDLLLSLRSNALNENDIGVLESLLFTFLALLDMNEDKQRLATEHGKELVETQEWAKMVLERMGEGGEEAERVRMLAAVVVVRCHEVVEKWQRLMLGDMVDL
ncbi:hypothetical protein EJ08DRAFT_691514 [Tothia fuscella]|uniref:Telomere length regulation protein conserved domain-containing protein n=1 Tax=Tothia fuscella TaxID=1048955 RepID=A0A9P4U3V8_9PEZI|nr:hypothetical protein EJ08DRAFT_691514 [Tothia fuscella]